MEMRGKRGQMTLFVIIALVIVAGILILLFFPNVRQTLVGQQQVSPKQYLMDCISPDLRINLQALADHGGYTNPQAFIVYNDQKIPYLCYTSNYYDPHCVVQQPMVKENFEKNLNAIIGTKASSCLSEMKSYYQGRGYAVSATGGSSNVAFNPGKITISYDVDMTLSKDGENTQTFNGIEINEDSKMYDLLMIANSIIDYETTYGDSETTLYMQYYPDLKIEKNKLSDGTKIYKLTNTVTKESFTFASRSLSWPAGYGHDEGVYS